MNDINIFFSDLDNTLIYSYKKIIAENKTVAEYIDGKEQSYITAFTLDFLKSYCRKKNNYFIPVTTRTLPQYSRLFDLQKQIGYSHSLICNGAILLDSGETDKEWEHESLKKGQPEKLHYIAPYMVYLKTEPNSEAEQFLHSHYTDKGIDIVYSSGKLYCIPDIFRKGNAVKRYLHKYYSDRAVNTFAAGDSAFDLSMFEQCDHSTGNISCSLPKNKYKQIDKSIISDDICNFINSHLLK